eukprot:scaffold240595_cov63-Attheya_sp.AAC.9
MPTKSVSPSKNPSDVPTRSVGPSIKPSISLDPTSTPVMILCFQSSPLNLTTHEAAANQLQGHVVSIHSAEENWLVVHITGTPAWIGLVDYAVEGDFVWIDGSDLNFTIWRSGEPDNNLGNQDCTLIAYSVQNEWDDGTCSDALPAVYKLPISSLCGAITAGYTCYEGDSTGCSSSLDCKTALTTC